MVWGRGSESSLTGTDEKIRAGGLGFGFGI